MSIRILALFTIFSIVFFVAASTASADVVKLKDGTVLEGVITKVEQGNVHVEVNKEDKVIDILKVESMDFNTPHMLATAANAPVDHFMKNVEAQEIVRNMAEIDRAAADIRKTLGQIRTYWAAKEPIKNEETGAWEAAKRDFTKPVSLYQEVLNDLYFHVLAKVDEYNSLMKEARDVYVGVKGIRVGSPLISKETERLPLKKYVPGAWFDTIYYEGYNRGYDEAYEKLNPYDR